MISEENRRSYKDEFSTTIKLQSEKVNRSINKHREEKKKIENGDKHKTYEALERINNKIAAKERVHSLSMQERILKAKEHNSAATCKATLQKEKNKEAIENLLRKTQQYDDNKKQAIVL